MPTSAMSSSKKGIELNKNAWRKLYLHLFIEGARYALRLPRPRSNVVVLEEVPQRDGDWAPDMGSRFEFVPEVSPVEGLLKNVQFSKVICDKRSLKASKVIMFLKNKYNFYMYSSIHLFIICNHKTYNPKFATISDVPNLGGWNKDVECKEVAK